MAVTRVPKSSDEALAKTFLPILRYDSQASYRAISAASITDNPGNRLRARRRFRWKKWTHASSRGFPELTLDTLTAEAHAKARTSPFISEAPDRLVDAGRMQTNPRYADRAYWRVVRDGKRTFVQYWFWFYCTPGARAGGTSSHEGAWRLAQVELNDDRPVRVTTDAFERAECHLANGKRPVLYVSPFTHTLYCQPGDAQYGMWSDGSDGADEVRAFCLESFSGWEEWPGRWGASGEASPVSPRFDARWKRPATRTHELVRFASKIIVSFYDLVSRPFGADRSPSPPRTIDGRLERDRVVVQFGFEREPPEHLYVTVHEASRVLAETSLAKVKSGQEHILELAEEVPECTVRASAVSAKGRRSAVVKRLLRSNEPDEQERAIFRAVVHEQLDSREVNEFAEQLDVDLEDVRRRVLKFEADPTLWRHVAGELQEFRDARAADSQLREAAESMAWATSIAAASTLVLLAFGASPVVLLFFDPELALYAVFGLVAVWYLPFFFGYSAWQAWSRRRAARAVRRRWTGASSDRGDEPLREPRRRFERALREKAIAPSVREQINESTRERYDLPLVFGDEGLPELRVRQYEVPTEATRRLEELTERMRGGSIGIAGPRGAGKTTLIRTFCEPRTTSDRKLTSVLGAPVQYEARDFVLTLFAQLCEAATGHIGELPPAPRIAGGGLRPFVPSAILTLLSVLALVPVGLVDGKWQWLFEALALISAVSAIVFFVRALRRRRRAPAGQHRDLGEELRLRAAEELRKIRFQQSYSYGYAGKLGLPAGAEVSLQAREDLAREQASYPEIVERLRAFIELAARARGRVVIGIDEMDKMESGEDAQKFLNEIKGIFGVDHCFYLVSISESAMSSFERRGLPFRDVFDSSFDEVLHVGPLSLGESKTLMRRRVVGLGPAYLNLCHCLSGGLARDLLRTVRQLSVLRDEAVSGRVSSDLAAAATSLVTNELQRKVAAAAVSARESALEPAFEPQLSALLFWLRGLCPPKVTPDTLLEHARTPPDPGLVSSLDGARSSGLEDVRLELAAFTYFLATVLKLFTSVGDAAKSYFEAAERPSSDGPSALERLAEARSAFGVDARVAIAIVDDVRARRSWPLLHLTMPTTTTGTAGSEARPS